MRKALLILFILIVQLGFSQQEPDSSFVPLYRHGVKYVFKLSSGMVFKGFVTDENRHYVTVQNRDAHETYDLRKAEIVSAKLYSDRKSYTDLVLGENMHAKNYMLTQAAFLFEAKKMYSNSHLLLLDNISYAFNEHWALTANTLAFFYPVSVGVKCAYALDETNYVGGSVFGFGTGGGSDGSYLFGFGAVGRFTRGTTNNNFTLMCGMIGITSNALVGSGAPPMLNFAFGGFAGCRRISKNIALTGEALYFPNADLGLAGAGIKLVGGDVTCWTFGCFTVLNGYNNTIQVNLKTIPIPYFGVSRNF